MVIPASRTKSLVRIGLAVGRGTGPEVAATFRQAIERLAGVHALDIQLIESPRIFHTYFSIEKTDQNPHDVAKEDAAAYSDLLRACASAGCRVIFRTAINAHSLYIIREQFAGVKLEFLQRPNGPMLFVRDEAQGFYGGENHIAATGDRIERHVVFSRDTTRRVIRFAIETAIEQWGSLAAIDHIVAAYKFHLLGDELASWVREIAAELGVEIQLNQPDTINRNLLRGLYPGNLLAIGANEWGDIMHADLISRFARATQEERCSRNVYLEDAVAGLEEYQTVHGSADDIAGLERVNPSATLQAAAMILERHGGVEGAAARMEQALRDTRAAGILTPDAGGAATTREMSEAVLRAYERAPLRSQAASPCALVLVDLQNDFCAKGGRFDHLELIDTDRIALLIERLSRLAGVARAAAIPVFFTRTIQAPDSLPDTIRERNRRQGREAFLRPDSWGAAFCNVVPESRDRIIDKASYDPFLNPLFEEELRQRGISQLVIGGFFADVCVDALARSAYQKGLEVTVLRDGTANLRHELDAALGFMEDFYCATTSACADVEDSWRSALVARE